MDLVFRQHLEWRADLSNADQERPLLKVEETKRLIITLPLARKHNNWRAPGAFNRSQFSFPYERNYKRQSVFVILPECPLFSSGSKKQRFFQWVLVRPGLPGALTQSEYMDISQGTQQ